MSKSSISRMPRAPRDRREDVGASAEPAIDVAILADTIAELEQSLAFQGLELSPRGRAEIIAETYLTAVTEAAAPDKRQIDRLVWMKAG